MATDTASMVQVLLASLVAGGADPVDVLGGVYDWAEDRARSTDENEWHEAADCILDAWKIINGNG